MNAHLRRPSSRAEPFHESDTSTDLDRVGADPRRAAMNRLNDQVALITGAARGIGAAIARAFVAEGARVHVTDIDDATGSAFAASLGAAADYRRLDVREEDAWRRVTEELCDRHGRIDAVVNNAGITGFEHGRGPHDPENASLDDWHAVHRTNLDGVFLGCKYAIRAMRQRGTGSIINISSRSGIVGIPAAAAYAASKAGVRNHTKTVALYCAQQGLAIRCNSIHPAAILTPMWDAILAMAPSATRGCDSSSAIPRCAGLARPTKSRLSPSCSPPTRRGT